MTFGDNSGVHSGTCLGSRTGTLLATNLGSVWDPKQDNLRPPIWDLFWDQLLDLFGIPNSICLGSQTGALLGPSTIETGSYIVVNTVKKISGALRRLAGASAVGALP
jgi:hypothetical protein